MFATGTQKRHWMFTGVTEIDQLRQEANERFVNEFGKNMDVSRCHSYTCNMFTLF